MTATFTAEEILEVCKGRLASGMSHEDAGAICTDTRALKEGDWYLALSGEKFDGHDFLGDAFSSGSLGAIVAERTHYAISNPQFPLLAVDDTLGAYHALARNWRRRIRPKVIAVTGSSGKTTTKEMCAAVLAPNRRCFSSAKNENNEFGVPKTLLAMPDDTQIAVIEMAMRGLGQIDVLGKCAVPDIAIITNVGTAHIELLHSRENIAKAKCEVLTHLNKDRGVAILGNDDPLLVETAEKTFPGKILVCSRQSLMIMDSDTRGTRFKIEGSNQIFEVHAHGLPLLQDAWCAVMAARAIGLNDDEILAGLQQFEIVSGRGNRMAAACGATVLDESYNANPDSVKAAILAMLDDQAYPQGRKVVVLGDLAELGDHTRKLLEELGAWLKDKPISTLISVGKLASYICDGASGAAFDVIRCGDAKEAEQELKSRLNKDTCVLIKGSRAARLEVLVKAIT